MSDLVDTKLYKFKILKNDQHFADKMHSLYIDMANSLCESDLEFRKSYPQIYKDNSLETRFKALSDALEKLFTSNDFLVQAILQMRVSIDGLYPRQTKEQSVATEKKFNSLLHRMYYIRKICLNRWESAEVGVDKDEILQTIANAYDSGVPLDTIELYAGISGGPKDFSARLKKDSK